MTIIPNNIQEWMNTIIKDDDNIGDDEKEEFKEFCETFNQEWKTFTWEDYLTCLLKSGEYDDLPYEDWEEFVMGYVNGEFGY